MTELILLIAVVGGLVLAGIVEAALHRGRLSRIPTRIHVNGTRGKSSVTRLIASALREAGIVTCAKTTGTLPRMIFPDGREYPVFRPARANVIEQLRIVRKAAAYGAQALVVECMALQPYLQSLTERKMIRATHAVITNAREDHLDVMGPTERHVALALAGMIPREKKVYTAEPHHLDVFEYVADARKATVVPVGADQIDAVTEQELAGFSYLEHAENIALALAVCADLGVDRETAIRGMQNGTPDPGVLTEAHLDFFGRRIVFVNGFAANDPESSERIWNMALERYPDFRNRIAIFNCRADRPERSQHLGMAVAKWTPATHLVLIGTGTYLFARSATKAGFDPNRMFFAEGRREDEIFESVIGLAGESALVMGLGNIGGQGLDLAQYFQNRSTVKGAA